MKDQLILFNTAKLAKEKGFNEYCENGYNSKKELVTIDISVESVIRGKSLKYKNSNLPKYSLENNQRWHIENCANITASTQSLLQKWLREHHRISIKIDDFFTNSKVRYDYNVSSLGSQDDNPKGVFPTYEDALEEALYYALGQIIIK